MNPPLLSLRVELEYRHGLGRLAAYFEALAGGRALGAECPDCGKAWFPPRPVCPVHGVPTQARELEGAGTVAGVTGATGALPFTSSKGPHGFVLVAMDGAVNLAFGRLALPAGEITVGLRVRLAGTADAPPHPAQSALFVPEEAL